VLAAPVGDMPLGGYLANGREAPSRASLSAVRFSTRP